MKGMLLTLALLASPAVAGPVSPAADRCPNCEATVTLSPSQAQSFAGMLQIINSMPLHGLVLDDGAATGHARVLVTTTPDYAARNHLDSFDVAKKVVGLATDPRYGIESVTATWQRVTVPRTSR